MVPGLVLHVPRVARNMVVLECVGIAGFGPSVDMSSPNAKGTVANMVVPRVGE